MHIILLLLILIVCLLLIFTVLAQNPKGGMAANFGASNQVMGARQTTDFLEKFTWGLSIALVILCLGATMAMPRSNIQASKSATERAIREAAEVQEQPDMTQLPGGAIQLEVPEGATQTEVSEGATQTEVEE